MKNRVFKKICGVMLSAMLMITMAIPVLANCAKDGHKIPEPASVSYPHVSETKHEKKTVISGTCTVCGQTLTVISTSNEDHTPDKNGKCTACGYQM